MLKVVLKKGKEVSLVRKHPWVFSGAIASTEGVLADGCTVQVISHQQKLLGYGHYQNSSIAVRMVSFDETEINQQFWNQRIQDAYDFRLQCGLAENSETNCYRLVFGESDGLPGLIMDYYNGTIVFQAHSIGMHLNRIAIVEALQKTYGNHLKAVYDKSKESLPGNYSGTIKNSFLMGSGEEDIVSEYGNRFHVNWVAGQKTGFFLDQRENRRLLQRYVKGKKVLNAFCYTGGFSVYAGNAGASVIHSVDSSARAMDMTEKNCSLNAISGHEGFCADVFEFLKGRTLDYDVVILDPPAFAKHRDAKHKAVIGYKNLNALALKKMKRGAVLFTFSCTQVVDRQLFMNTISAAAIEANREVRVLHYLHQPCDHPVNLMHPESEYLKGLVLSVVK
jgi:23S rRNA (cytosine1962-C5)-methyltransferase